MNDAAHDYTRTVTVGGLDFNVYVRGEGEVVLLLHGFPDDHTMWKRLIPLLLAQGYQVIALDQRGCGESDAPVGKKHYKIRTIVDDIPPILDQLGVHSPIAVLSHDWGAVIGWGLSLFYPKRVRAHVAISVGHPHSYVRAGFQQFVKGFYQLWFQLTGITEFYLLHGGFSRLLSGHHDVPGVVRKMSRPGRLTAALNWYRANFIGAVVTRWPRCAVPTLGIWSSEDVYLTEEQMCNSEKCMDAEWDYRRIEGAGHWVPQDAPEQVVDLACDWFSRHE